LHTNHDIIEPKTPVTSQTNLGLRNGIKCPYEYILYVYGKNHFSRFVDTLKAGLRSQDPGLFELVLQIMDAIHFGAILGDDVADNSLLRKGKSAAHCLYGSSETINRAYLRILEVIARCYKQRPSLVPYILLALTQVF